MSQTIPEYRVAEIWQSAIQQRRDLKTAAGGPVKILYPGRFNDGRGADIKDAVIETAHGLLKGDIEFHVRSSAWQEHGHHTDPAYNQVILHVVYEHDAGLKARLQNGLEIPTLLLEPLTEKQAGQRISSVFTSNCITPCLTDPERIGGELEKAGEARSLIKSLEYEEIILEHGAEQALYRGMMTALGYSKNKTPMGKLAEEIPLQELEELLRSKEADSTCLRQIQARLLGGAGLLVSQGGPQRLPDIFSETDINELERIWEGSGNKAEMSYKEWEFFKVRPGNYPACRIAGMAVLITRMKNRGIVGELEGVVLKAAGDGGKTLENALVVVADERCTDTERARQSGNKAAALVGRERAGEIIINVILPFFTAYARAMENPALEEAAFKAYRYYRTGAENSVEKHMRKQLGIPLQAAATAMRRQGLIHLYKAFCTQGRCVECPLHRGGG
jgi:hypothetical protein